jgi:opacity protein-like surface antigen
MTSLLKGAALAAMLVLPLTAAQAQQQQGSNQAQGYAQSHGAAGAFHYGGAYARYGGHRHFYRY